MTNAKPHKSPHDSYVRRTFDLLPMAKDFFQNSLPANILKAINLDTLQPTDKTFISDHMQKEVADILFKVDVNGSPAYIYMLVEHMSSQNKWLSYRMLKYVMSVMKYHLDTNPRVEHLPLVIPMIFHTGKQSFKHSLDIMDLFGSQKDLAKEVMFKPIHLVDLPSESDEALQRFQAFQMAAMLMKHIGDPDIIPTLHRVGHLVQFLKENGYDAYVDVTMTYIWEAGRAEDKSAFKKAIKEVIPNVKEEDFMRICEMFQEDVKVLAENRGMQQGLALGIEQGIEQGLELGRLQEKRDMVIKMLDKHMSIAIVSEITGMSEEQIRSFIH